MGSWSRSDPRSATTGGGGCPAGRNRWAGAGRVCAGADEPDPKAVSMNVTSRAIDTAIKPAIRRALRLAAARAFDVRRVNPGARRRLLPDFGRLERESADGESRLSAKRTWGGGLGEPGCSPSGSDCVLF